MRFKQLLIACLLLSFFSGCSIVNLASIQMPGNDIDKFQKFYVEKLDTDKRNIDIIIRDQLQEMGYEAFTKESNIDRSSIDAIVTYRDRWMWDMRNYLLQLTIHIKSTNSDFVVGAGKSFRTSLDAKSPEYVVKEVLEDIFNPKTVAK